MELDGPEAPPPGVPSWLPPLLQGRQRSFEETVEEEKRLAPQSAEFLSRIASLREDKLYHELTDALARYLQCFSFCDSAIPPSRRPGAACGGEEDGALPCSAIEVGSEEGAQRRVAFFLGAVWSERRHLDRLRVALMLRDVCRSLEPRGACALLEFAGAGTQSGAASGNENADAAAFALPGSEASAELKSRAEGASRLFLSCVLAFHKARAGDAREAEAILDEPNAVLSKAAAFDPAVRAALHRAQAEVALIRKKNAACYRETLFFLAYTPAESLDPSEQVHVSLQAARAALVADSVFNFGELLQQGTVVAALRESESHRWLYALLQAFSVGCIETVFKILDGNSSQLEAAGLAEHRALLRDKAAVCALVRLAFTSSTAGAAAASLSSSSSSLTNASTTTAGGGVGGGARLGGGGEASRRLSFAAIAAACRVPMEGVERLVISAIARKLLRGKLDDVAQLVVVDWVRPVLIADGDSLRALQGRLCRWAASVSEVQKTLRSQAHELLGA